MICPRCRGLLIIAEHEGRACIACGHVEWDSVMDKDEAKAERTGKRGKLPGPPRRRRLV